MRLPLDAVMFIKPLGQTVLQKKMWKQRIILSNIKCCHLFWQRVTVSINVIYPSRFQLTSALVNKGK